jgi:hypothetical protein
MKARTGAQHDSARAAIGDGAGDFATEWPSRSIAVTTATSPA